MQDIKIINEMDRETVLQRRLASQWQKGADCRRSVIESERLMPPNGVKFADKKKV